MVVFQGGGGKITDRSFYRFAKNEPRRLSADEFVLKIQYCQCYENATFLKM